MRRPAAPAIVTLGAVGGVIAVVLWQLHPSLLLSNTTITGGDTGAHVGLAGFLKSNLLPSGHVTGWDPGAYDGFPLNTFYFPLPDLLAALAGFIVPFNIAFKLMTILGSVLLPVAAWLFGRLSGLERPRPAVLAIATLPFLFEQSFQIYGGNLYSTMAGEYAFSLGLSVALIFLGLAVRGMRTGRFRALAAVVLGLCILCHLLTAIFALTGALVIFVLAGPTRKRLWWMVCSVGGGLLLVSWWIVPFVADRAYSTNMGWQNVTGFAHILSPGEDLWAVIMAGLGAVLAVVVAITQRQSAPLLLVVLGIGAGVMVRFDPQWQLYNVRFLPFWFFCIYMLAGFFVAELGVAVARAIRHLRLSLWRDSPLDTWVPVPTLDPVPATTPPWIPGGMTPAMVGAVPGSGPGTISGFEAETVGHGSRNDELVGVGAGVGAGDGAAASAGPGSPAGESWPRPHFAPWAPGAVTVPIVSMIAALLLVLTPLVPWMDTHVSSILHHQFAPSSVSGWADWNYSGYQNKPGWKELDDGIIPTLERVAHKDGCGRTMWEYNSSLNRFGTPESLMLLPYFTNNCIASMEGVLFESASSTAYHFINQAELSAAPSEAMVSTTTGVQYGPLDVALGVQHLQLLGVKYFMASSSSVQAEADVDPQLQLVATTGPWPSQYTGATPSTTWKIYLVRHASVVKALTKTPDVLTATGPQQPSWLPVAQSWYADPGRWNQQLVAGGPSSWARTATPSKAPPGKPLPKVHVSDVKMGIDTVSFHVDRTGVPVVVGVSYFPNWQVTGASGPWRSEPNLMVVDPTSHDVTLTYGATGADHVGLILTIIGLVVLVVLIRRRSFAPAWTPFSRLPRGQRS